MRNRARDQRCKLVLERRTLRTLDARDLGRVAGGAKRDADADYDFAFGLGGIEISRKRGTV